MPRRVDLLFSHMVVGHLLPFFDTLFPEALNLIEFFHQAPRREELLSGTLKQLLVRDTRDAEAMLILLCAGKPETLLKEIEAKHRAGAMTGLYNLAPHHRTLIVVIAESPRTLETLLMRLIGAGKTLKRAIAKELYQNWEAKTREEGRQEGRQEGVAAAQEITLLRMRFGEVEVELDAQLSSVRDLQRLQALTPTVAAGTIDAIREALTDGQ